ncbi:hypothetical protein ACHAWO_003126 [Cyclotella atomus]|uniref:MYND-type domain-containing protein n=1 Tax=Cyclotella atomus TaxID=382360 RepID=A0ABD3NKY1_9STRA
MAIKMQVKFDGTYGKFCIEMKPVADATIWCRLGSVRFVHKRNSCQCLEELHSKLKQTTVRKTRCGYCGELKDSREIKECLGCKVNQYCSRDCQLADFPRHKEDCEYIKGSSGKRTNETDSIVSSFCEMEFGLNEMVGWVPTNPT